VNQFFNFLLSAVVYTLSHEFSVSDFVRENRKFTDIYYFCSRFIVYAITTDCLNKLYKN